MPVNFSLPSQECTFEIDVTGDRTGERYKGTFSYKRLNLGAARRANCEKARLMEDLKNLDSETKMLCEMIAWLNQGLLQAPPWWSDPWDLYDYNVIMSVYDKVLQFENDFYNKINDIGKADLPQDNTSSEEDSENVNEEEDIITNEE